MPQLIVVALNHGFGEYEGARALSLLNGASMLGMVMGGWASDRFNRRNVLGLVYMLGFVGIVILSFAGSLFRLYFSAGLFGVGLGASFPVWAPLLKEYYGSSDVARLLGVAGAIFLLGWAPSAIFLGLSYDFWRSYSPGLLAAAFFLLAASVLIVVVRIEKAVVFGTSANDNRERSHGIEHVTLRCSRVGSRVSVTKLSLKLAQKRTITEQIQKTEIVAIVQLAKGFS